MIAYVYIYITKNINLHIAHCITRIFLNIAGNNLVPFKSHSFSSEFLIASWYTHQKFYVYDVEKLTMGSRRRINLKLKRIINF